MPSTTPTRGIGATISKGKTPIEAAHEAVRYFTNEVIQHARGGAHGKGWMRGGLEAQEQSAFAKFLDQLTMLDGLVTPGDV
jgi:hypothetical protein